VEIDETVADVVRQDLASPQVRPRRRTRVEMLNERIRIYEQASKKRASKKGGEE
jgi:hypothetical protein